jgi:transglutaminase-like putative cysteine protease
MPKFKIQHITRYSYEIPVRDSANQIMLYPVSDEFQEVLFHRVSISGNPAVELHNDVFGNEVGTFTHPRPHSELRIDSVCEVLTRARPLPADTMPASEQWKILDTTKFEFPNIEFLRPEQFDALPELREAMDRIHQPELTPLQCSLKFNAFVFENFIYQKGITTVDTTLDEIWRLRSGVCQDFAHILLAMLRLSGIPARYVSGYICPNKNGMRGEGATHAWVEANIPAYGWLGLDPTNNCIANENHVRLAVGKNYYDCSPVRGTYRGTSSHQLHVAVTVGYEDGEVSPPSEPTLQAVTTASGKPLNSFQRYQEMQQQQ